MMMMIHFFLIPRDSSATIIDLRIVSWYFNEMFSEDIFDDIDTKF